MNKLPLLSLLALGTAAQAALISHEAFDYAAGSVDGQTGGTGWHASGWDSQDDNANYAVTDSTPLSFGSLLTGGNYLNGGGGFQNSGRRLSTGSGSGWDTAGAVSDPFSAGAGVANLDQGTVWVSMLVRVNASITSWDAMRIWFHSQNIAWSPDGDGLTNGLNIRINGSGPWSVSEGRDGGSTSTGVSVSLGTTYFAVAKFELSLTAGANNAYVWIFDNPSSVTLGGADLSTGSAMASITGRDTNDLRFKSIGFYLDNASNRVSVDEIRLGTSFADVSPVPEPSSAMLALLGGAALLRRRRAA